MKKIMAVALCAAMAFGITAGASDIEKTQTPFERGSLGCNEFRIPSLITLADGSVAAAADMRWGHGKDSPQNIDTLFALSANGRDNWEYTVVNRFDDYADGADSPESASFIDSAMVQSADGTLFLITEAYSSGTGILNTRRGNGCLVYEGNNYIALAKKGTDNYIYHIADFENGFAPVMQGAENTGYSVDEEYRLYKDGVALTLPQLGSDGKPTGEQVMQSIFYKESDFCVFPTPYIWLRTSGDSGKTWSKPLILNPMVTLDSDYFLGVCPGRGITVTTDAGERIIFNVYHSRAGGDEKAMSVYSDDGGKTWSRGGEVKHAAMLQKTSESQTVTLPDGKLRMFSRNKSRFISVCDSADGGVTWSKAMPDPALRGTPNCMVSFINYSRKINGKSVIISSSGGSYSSRANGVVRLGLVDDAGGIDWITAYRVNEGFYAYSCLTELDDGRVALLYEDEASHINYMILSVGESGEITRADGDDISFEEKKDFRYRLTEFADRILLFFTKLFK